MVFKIDDDTKFKHHLNMGIELVNEIICVWMMFDVDNTHYLYTI